MTAPRVHIPKNDRHAGRTRFWFATVAVALYGAVIAAPFGGFAFDHLPERGVVRLAIVAFGACVVLLLALWLDRHEARRQ